MKRIVIKVQGGLGNQLFGVFAGLYVADKLKSKLVVDTSLLDYDRHSEQNIYENISIKFNNYSSEFILRKKITKAFIEKIRRIIYRLMGHNKFLHRLTRQFRSQVVGYDSNLDTIYSSCCMYGYFQTYSYVSNLIEAKGPLVISQKYFSTWYESMKENILSSSPSIGVHYRRGDYKESGNIETIGLLSGTYFENALRRVQKSKKYSKVFIFSDSPADAEEFFSQLGLLNFEVVNSNASSSPLESLLLLSYCDAKIISNSTFSWWAAHLGGNDSLVIAPDPWFRNLDQPTKLLPPNWTTIPVNWQD